MRTALLLLAAGVGLAGAAVQAPAAGKPQFVYVHDRSGVGEVHAWSLDSDGTLTPVPGMPFAGMESGGTCGGHCQTMASSAKRRMLFTSGSSGISAWVRGTNGALTLVPGSPFIPGSGEYHGVAALDSGKNTFVYVADIAGSKIHGFIVTEDGTLDELPGSPWPAGTNPDGIVASKKGLFTANEGNSTISSYAIGKDGALTEAPGSPFAAGTGFTYNLAVDPKGKALFVPDCDDGLVRVFKVNTKTAALTSSTGGPYETTLFDTCSGLAVSSKLLVAVSLAFPEDLLRVFKKSATGALVPLGNLQNGGSAGIASHAFDTKGKILVVANGDVEVRTLLVNAKSGAAVTADTEPLSANGVNAVVVVK